MYRNACEKQNVKNARVSELSEVAARQMKAKWTEFLARNIVADPKLQV